MKITNFVILRAEGGFLNNFGARSYGWHAVHILSYYDDICVFFSFSSYLCVNFPVVCNIEALEGGSPSIAYPFNYLKYIPYP